MNIILIFSKVYRTVRAKTLHALENASNNFILPYYENKFSSSESTAPGVGSRLMWENKRLSVCVAHLFYYKKQKKFKNNFTENNHKLILKLKEK